MSDVSKISINGIEYSIKDQTARDFMGNYKSMNEVVEEIKKQCVDSLNKSILGGAS